MRALIAVACAAGCYRPSIVNCQYSCATGNACPEGFVCDQGNCVGSIGEPCGPVPDGTPSELIGEAGCAWSYAVSNVNPCQFAGITGDWLVLTSNTTMIDTDARTIMGDAPPPGSIHTAKDSSGNDMMVVYVGELDLGRDATFLVTGLTPLVILADTRASIDGVIDLSAHAIICLTSGAGSPGGFGGGIGGGGGGGSLGIVTIFSNGAGSAGGSGGSGGAGGPAGTPIADTSLVPLVGGCPGGDGGAAINSGGHGGGALQISTRGTLDIGLGQLRANGGGGASSLTGGGGGGGGGGGILLEATTTTFKTGSAVCANGGGGGASGVSGTKGQDGACTLVGAHGAGTPGAPGSGGDGETASDFSVVGQDGTGGTGGGGGGGGVGIIRVNGNIDIQGGTQSPHVTQ